MKFFSIKKEFKWVFVALILSGMISISTSVIFAQDKTPEQTQTTHTTETPTSTKADKSWGFVDLFF